MKVPKAKFVPVLRTKSITSEPETQGIGQTAALLIKAHQGTDLWTIKNPERRLL